MALLIHFIALAILGVSSAEPLFNITYGSDPEQQLDLYLPSSEDPSTVSKVFVLIHGGAWGGGYKDEMDQFVPHLQTDFPNHAIANINYRLGTHESPGFPKQLEDIDLALTFLQQTFTSDVTFALYGGSAGAHLAMLYAYSWTSSPAAAAVKLIVDLVGPTDLVHPSYSAEPLYAELFYALVGPCLYSECPELYNVTSPITYANPSVPPTIGFYGNFDLLVPNPQMNIIQDKLNELGVVNQFVRYVGGHEWNWSEADKRDMRAKITSFANTNWV